MFTIFILFYFIIDIYLSPYAQNRCPTKLSHENHLNNMPLRISVGRAHWSENGFNALGILHFLFTTIALILANYKD